MWVGYDGVSSFGWISNPPGNNPSEYWPCALDIHGSLMRDRSSTAFYSVPGAFSTFLFMPRWKILELIMTWWPWKWHFRCIHSLHSDDAQVILAHYRGSRKDWDQQWWPAIALCVDLCPDAACWRYKQHVTKSLTGMGYKFRFLQKHGYRCKLLLIINKPVENRKVAFLTKNILSARRGKNFSVGVVFLVWEYLVAFFLVWDLLE